MFQRLNSMKSLTLRAVAVLVAGMMLTISAAAQLLDQVPADALLVARVKNMQQVSDKAGALAKQWGLAEMNPAAGDPLGWLQQHANLMQGVDKSGDMAIVLANGDLDGAQPPLIILFPVTDYGQFIGNFAGAAKDGELDHFKMKFNGEEDKEETYAAHWGGYAALSPMKELLTKKPDGFKASGIASRELASKDVVICVNFKVLGPKLNEMLKPQREKILSEVEKTLNANADQAKYLPLAKVVITQALNTASEFLSDAQFASYSLNLGTDGVVTTLSADFTPDSYFGKAFAEAKPSGDSLTAGLPDAKYLMFGGASASDSGKKLFTDFLAPIEKELANAGDQLKPVVAYVNGLKKMMSAAKAQTGGLIAPTGALGTTSLLQTVGIITGDPKAIIEAEHEMVDAQQQLMSLVPNQPQGMKVEFKADAKTLEGVSFAQLSTTFGDGDSPQAAQMKQMMAMMYGPGGATVYLGALDDQHVLIYIGLDDAAAIAAIKAAKEHAETVGKSEAVEKVNKHLPEAKLMVGYFSLGELVGTVSNYAKMMGMPIPVSMKADLPPIGLAVATEGSSVRMDTFIPSELVEQTIATVLQLKMMGGAGNGKPGGL